MSEPWVNQLRDALGMWTKGGGSSTGAHHAFKGRGNASAFLDKKYPSVQSTLSENDDRIVLHKVVVPKDARNSGTGTAYMRDLVAYADAKGKRVELTPSSDFGGSVPRLKSFYKSLGFVENKGKNRDFEISEDMYRLPNTRALIDYLKRGGK